MTTQTLANSGLDNGLQFDGTKPLPKLTNVDSPFKLFRGIYLLIKTHVECKAWTSEYIPLFHVEVITYPYTNFNAGLANLCL